MAVKTAALVFMLCVFVAARGEEEAPATSDDDRNSASSWAGWATNTFSRGINMGSEEAQRAAEKTQEAAGEATDTVNSATFETSKQASEKASDFAQSTWQKMKPEDQDTEGTGQGIKDGGSEAYEKGKEKIKMATEKASDLYEDAKEKVGETYESMSAEARQKYEAAKERASQAAGDIGAQMRRGSAEL